MLGIEKEQAPLESVVAAQSETQALVFHAPKLETLQPVPPAGQVTLRVLVLVPTDPASHAADSDVDGCSAGHVTNIDAEAVEHAAPLQALTDTAQLPFVKPLGPATPDHAVDSPKSKLFENAPLARVTV